MSQATAFEQYLLELVNQERGRAGVQPLAFDGDLNEAADAHNQWMIATDSFSHTGSGGSSPGQRMADAGYVFSGSWTWGENIAWATTRSPSGFQDEVQLLHTNLMNSPGHRANLLSDSFREVGLGFEIGEYAGRQAAFVTENFARTGGSLFLTGVAFDDQDGDRFYDPGEGLAGLTVTAVSGSGARYTTTTEQAGGYDLALPGGTYSVTFTGGGFAPTTLQASLGGRNAKLDLIDPSVASSGGGGNPGGGTPGGGTTPGGGSTGGGSAPFNALEYIASYPDLMNAFGANADAGVWHYNNWGRSEGRVVSFDGLQYIASYSDLVRAFGANDSAGAAHYINWGRSEGRATDTFDAARYLANYADLRAAFGSNEEAATIHFINYGLNEGRTDDLV
jgi:hypothetical protein